MIKIRYFKTPDKYFKFIHKYKDKYKIIKVDYKKNATIIIVKYEIKHN